MLRSVQTIHVCLANDTAQRKKILNASLPVRCLLRSSVRELHSNSISIYPVSYSNFASKLSFLSPRAHIFSPSAQPIESVRTFRDSRYSDHPTTPEATASEQLLLALGIAVQRLPQGSMGEQNAMIICFA